MGQRDSARWAPIHDREPDPITEPLRQGLQLAIDSSVAALDAICDIIVTDTNCKGLSAAMANVLIAGARVAVEVPLIGWREAEIRWIAGNRAGCHFVQPVSDEEMRAALCANSTLCQCFPGLLGGSAAS